MAVRLSKLKTFLACTASLALIAPAAPAQTPIDAPPAADKESAHPRVVVALGGGGAKACAEIGVLRVLEQSGVHIDGIVGTSIGAVIGGMYCAGVPLDTIQECIVQGKLHKSMIPGITSIVVHEVAHFVHPRSLAGISGGKKFKHYLIKCMNGDRQISALQTPFTAVATNMQTGKPVFLDQGSTSSAIVASASMPPFFQPYKSGDQLLIDGGLVANVPAQKARESGADIVIGVCVDTFVKPIQPAVLKHLRRTVGRVSDIYVQGNDRLQAQYADVWIHPDVDAIPLAEKSKRKLRYGIEQGETAARRALPYIQDAIAHAEDKRQVVGDDPSKKRI